MNDTELNNTVSLIRSITHSTTIKVLLLCRTPHTHTDIIRAIYSGDHSKSGALSYHTRQLRESQLIEPDHITGAYSLTFKGLKVAEMILSLSKIANLSMETIHYTKAKTAVNLNEVECWLAPLLKHELRKALGNA